MSVSFPHKTRKFSQKQNQHLITTKETHRKHRLKIAPLMSDHLIYSFSRRKKAPVVPSSLQFPPVPHRKRLLKITLVMSDHLIHRYHPIYSFSRRKKGSHCSQFPPVPSSSPRLRGSSGRRGTAKCSSGPAARDDADYRHHAHPQK